MPNEHAPELKRQLEESALRIRGHVDKINYEIAKLPSHVQPGLFMYCCQAIIDGIIVNQKGATK